MITVLIVVGVCWFVAALLFVLALGFSARRRFPSRETRVSATVKTENKKGEFVATKRRGSFWSRAKRAALTG